MGVSNLQDNGSRSGFTLIEVAFAIFILSSSLVVLLGLQSSVVQRELRDRHRIDAMLIARSILAATEIIQDPGSERSIEGTPERVLGSLITAPPEERGERESRETYGVEYYVRYQVSPWEFPNLEPNTVRRVLVEVSWGDLPTDSLVVSYFVPFKEETA